MVNALSGSTVPLTAVNSVIVVGGGLAGLRTGQSLRSLGFTGKIVLVSLEAHAPYDRPPLSKKILVNEAPVDLATDFSADLESIFDEFLHLHRAVALSESAQGITVKLEPVTSPQHFEGADLAPATFDVSADVVVLALGAQPVMPSHWNGIHTLYSWEDTEKLRAHLHMPPCEDGKTTDLLIIGSGWVGTEIAGIAQDQGLKVSVVEAESTPLLRQVGEKVGARIAQWFAQSGVDLHTNSYVTSVGIQGPDVVVTGTGSSGAGSHGSSDWVTKSKLVLSAVGVQPSTSWLPSHFARTAQGALLTDEWGHVLIESPRQMASSRVFSVGDSAQRADPIHGHVSGGHWNLALTDPERIALAITSIGGPTPIPPATPTPYVFSTQFGHEIALFGIPQPANDDVIFRDYPDGGWTALYVKQVQEQHDSVKASGIFTCDAPRDAATARKILRDGEIPVNNPNLLSQVEIPLKRALL